MPSSGSGGGRSTSRPRSGARSGTAAASRLRDGLELDKDLQGRIRRRVREGASPRHVPARIIQVEDIPRTLSGKITELAVRDVIPGRPVRNTEGARRPAGARARQGLVGAAGM